MFLLHGRPDLRQIRHLLWALMAGEAAASRNPWPCRKYGVAYHPGLTEQASGGHGRAIEGAEDKNKVTEEV